jgi:hypothetical protein
MAPSLLDINQGLDRKLVCVESISEKPAGRLRRVLTLWDLIVYGIVLISPIAAVPLFGVVQQLFSSTAAPRSRPASSRRRHPLRRHHLQGVPQ